MVCPARVIEKRRVPRISGIIENSPYIGLFLLLILGGIGVPLFPEDATFILCGVLIGASVVKTVPALLVVYVGVLIADLMIYNFGKKYGRMVVSHKWFHRVLPPGKLLKLEEKFKQKGIYFILLGRHLIGVRVQVLMVSGIMKMPALKFLIIDALTASITISLWTTVGYGGSHGLRDFGIEVLKRIPFLPI